MRRLARQCNKSRDYEGLDEIGLYLGQSLAMFETYFSDHEFAQLVGANYKQVEKLRRDYDADGCQTPFFVILLLSGLEQDLEQPLANALLKTLRREFAEDPASLKRLRNALENMTPEMRGEYYKVVVDAAGNEHRVKYYPPLKVIKKR